MADIELYEVGRLLEGVMYKHRATWEANRLTAYVVAQGNSKKKLKPQDIIRFPYEVVEAAENKRTQLKARGKEWRKTLVNTLDGIFEGFEPAMKQHRK